MNLDEVNKWLNDEFGCSYTRLEELHDFYFEKYSDLQQENQQLKDRINKAINLVEKWDNETNCAIDDYFFKEDLLEILKGVKDDKTNN